MLQLQSVPYKPGNFLWSSSAIALLVFLGVFGIEPALEHAGLQAGGALW